MLGNDVTFAIRFESRSNVLAIVLARSNLDILSPAMFKIPVRLGWQSIIYLIELASKSDVIGE